MFYSRFQIFVQSNTKSSSCVLQYFSSNTWTTFVIPSEIVLLEPGLYWLANTFGGQVGYRYNDGSDVGLTMVIANGKFIFAQID